MAAMEMDVEAPPASKSVEESVQGMYRSMVNIQESSLLMMLCLTSAIEMFAGIGICDTRNYCQGLYGWAVSAGAVSLALSLPMLFLLYLKYGLYEKIVAPAAAFIFVWWILGAGITTFAGPFFQVGNGYIGAWGAFLSSFLLAHSRIAGSSWQQQLSGQIKTLKAKMGKKPGENDATQTSATVPPPPPGGEQPASTAPVPPTEY